MKHVQKFSLILFIVISFFLIKCSDSGSSTAANTDTDLLDTNTDYTQMCFTPDNGITQVVSKPGEYSRYSEATHDGWQRFSQYVLVRDGVKLAVDIYRPTSGGILEQTALPVIFQFTPYRRATYTTVNNPDGTKTIKINYPDTTFTKYGYVMVYADVRGKGASFGTRIGMGDRTEAMDAHDLIEWIGRQPWCDGKVGMWGGSYVGYTQVAAASTAPRYLKAVFPEITDYAKYDATYRGGMHRSTSGGGETQNDLVTAPVDEDVLDVNNNGIPDMLEAAAAQHVSPYLPEEYKYLNFVARMLYRNSVDTLLGDYWINVSAYPYFNKMKKSGIAFYQSGGWYDLFARDTPLGFNNLKERGKLLLSPNGHFWTDPSAALVNMTIERLRFFDYWLKGIGNGLMDEPPVYYYTVNAPSGTEWRYSPQWPLAEKEETRFYLNAGPSGSSPVSILDGSLSTESPKDKFARDDYTPNYAVTSTHMMGYSSYDKWGLTYTTSTLASDIQITGSPVVHLWISSTATDGDFFADLEDIDENGAVARVVATQGRLRASHRILGKAPFDNMDLPWHPSNEEDMIPLTPNTPTELVFDILPASHVFKAGHRIRLTITNASKHVLTYLQPAATVSIYRNKTHRSYVSLPIIPKLNIFQGIANIHSRYETYEGPANLYASPTAIYVNYEGKWLKWKTLESRDKCRTEYYMGKGNMGFISVFVTDNDRMVFDALAKGNGIQFKGELKYK
jgi:uncharacterized protein